MGGGWWLSRQPAGKRTAATRVKTAVKESSGRASAVAAAEPPARTDKPSTTVTPSPRGHPAQVRANVEPEPVPPEIAHAFPSITEAVADWREFRPDNLTVEPWPGARITFTRSAVKDEGRYVTWIGRNPELPGASLVGVATADGYDAILVMPGANQVSYHVRGDEVVTTEAAPGAEGCGNAPVQPSKSVTTAAVFVYDVSYAKGHEPAAETATTHAVGAALNVDVLVAYDAETLAAAAAKSSDPTGYIDGQCKAMLETSNLALEQSLVPAFVWRYLGSVPAPVYTRTGKLQDDIDALKPGGAISDWVKTIRYRRGADQILLMVGGAADWGGIASSLKQTAISRDYANAVMKWGRSYVTFAHELAHNFGCKHDRAHTEVISEGTYGPPSPDNDGFWCYGQMWDNPAIPGGADPGTSGTIMSYADYRIPYFSNPNITVHVTGFMVGWSWNPNLGTHQTGRAESDPKAAYNARVLSEQAAAMSALSEEIAMPAITQQPTAASVIRDQSLSVRVTATGGGLSYQWKKNGTVIEGATASIYSKIASDADAGNYSVVVSNLAGSVTSAEATIAVTSPPPPAAPSNPGNSGGGGGGGAPSRWFYSALAFGALCRWLAGRVRAN